MGMMPIEIEHRLFILGWIFIIFVACGGSSSPQPHDKTVFSISFDSGNLEDAQHLYGHRFLVKPMPDFGNDGAEAATWNGLTWWYHFSVTVPQGNLPYPIEMEIDASRVLLSHRIASLCDNNTG